MNCSKCHAELNDENWLTSRKKRNQYICKYCIRVDNFTRYQLRKTQYLVSQRDKRFKIKMNVLEYYGSACALCGQTDFNNLSLDHIDGSGRRERKTILGIDSGSGFYNWVLNNKPNNIRLLCFNCNCKVDMTKKELNKIYIVGCKYCGANEKYRNTKSCSKCHQINKRNKYIDLKLEVFSHYGLKCAHCEENKIEYLTMDHINNDGAYHRKEVGTQIFPWLKKHNYPINFQILCFNCNYGKSFELLKI